VPSPNGEVEGPPRSAQQAPRAHAVFQRPRCETTHRSRSPPTIVRTPCYHGYQTDAAETGGCCKASEVGKDLNPGVEHCAWAHYQSPQENRGRSRADCTKTECRGFHRCYWRGSPPKARDDEGKARNKGYCDKHECGLEQRTHGVLTVKLRGRPEAPDQRRGRTLSSCARGE
jgi:hypothetical protein